MRSKKDAVERESRDRVEVDEYEKLRYERISVRFLENILRLIRRYERTSVRF